MENFKEAPTLEQKRAILGEISHQLSLHAGAEEIMLYPIARHVIPDKDMGNRLSDHSLEEHQRIKEQLDRMFGLEEDALLPEFSQLVAEVKHHVQEEEEKLFPVMRENLSAGQQQTMAKVFRVAKFLSPTRPHPSAPNKPPLNLLVGSLAAVFDRLQDFLRGYPQ